jgi:hypothetical protein
MDDRSLLDIWCALNSSFGGPLLAIVTVGGLLAVGRTLINFPARDTQHVIAARNANNRQRRCVFYIGAAALSALIINIAVYILAFGSVRQNALVCVNPPLTDPARRMLFFFLGFTILTAVISLFYFWRLVGLKRTMGVS